MLFLALSNLGLSYLTTFVGMLVGVMSACFMAECVLSPPGMLPPLPFAQTDLARRSVCRMPACGIERVRMPVDRCLQVSHFCASSADASSAGEEAEEETRHEWLPPNACMRCKD